MANHLPVASDALPAYDPYEPRPTFLQRHGEYVAALVVFGFTVLLAVISFPPFKAPESAYAMLVPGIYWAYTKPRLKLYAWTIGAAQAVAWIIILNWLHHVTWIGLFLLGSFVGLWIGTWYLAVWWTMPRLLGRPTLTRLVVQLGLAGVWVLIEWTRTWFLGGFSWLPLSASQWQTVSILQVAPYTGSYGISFVLVAVNIGFAAYAHRLFREGATGFNKRSQEFFLGVFLLLGCLCLHFQEAFNRGHFSAPLARVAFVQPNIPQEVKWDAQKAPEILQVLKETTLAAGGLKPDIVLWPEASTPWTIRGDNSLQSFVQTLATEVRAPLLLGSIAIENENKPNEQWFNGVFIVSPDSGVQHDFYAKRHLVPFGEYIPLHPVLGWLKKVVPIGGDFTPGADSSPLIVNTRSGPLVFGPLICYEDIFPPLARYSARAESNVLTVVTNDGWYGESGAAYQHAANSVLRAVETRRPVLRCGNAGWSGWIDEFGVIRAVLTRDPQGEIHTEPLFAEKGTIYFRGTAAVNVTRDSRWINQQTFYTEHGDWFVALSLGLAVFAFFALRLAPPAAGPEEIPATEPPAV